MIAFKLKVDRKKLNPVGQVMSFKVREVTEAKLSVYKFKERIESRRQRRVEYHITTGPQNLSSVLTSRTLAEPLCSRQNFAQLQRERHAQFMEQRCATRKVEKKVVAEPIPKALKHKKLASTAAQAKVKTGVSSSALFLAGEKKKKAAKPVLLPLMVKNKAARPFPQDAKHEILVIAGHAKVEVVAAQLNKLAPTSVRCLKFSLNGGFHQVAGDTILADAVARHPKIHHLIIDYGGINAEEFTAWAKTNFGLFPRLRSLVVVAQNLDSVPVWKFVEPFAAKLYQLDMTVRNFGCSRAPPPIHTKDKLSFRSLKSISLKGADQGYGVIYDILNYAFPAVEAVRLQGTINVVQSAHRMSSFLTCFPILRLLVFVDLEGKFIQDLPLPNAQILVKATMDKKVKLSPSYLVQAQPPMVEDRVMDYEFYLNKAIVKANNFIVKADKVILEADGLKQKLKQAKLSGDRGALKALLTKFRNSRMFG